MSELVLDIGCAACHRRGDENPPRFVRFFRRDDGRIEPQPFTVDGQQVTPYPHIRPDGGTTWQLICSQGHDRPARHERVVQAFDVMATRGLDNQRILL